MADTDVPEPEPQPGHQPPPRPSLEPPRLFGRRRTSAGRAPEPAPTPAVKPTPEPPAGADTQALPASEPVFVDAGVDATVRQPVATTADPDGSPPVAPASPQRRLRRVTLPPRPPRGSFAVPDRVGAPAAGLLTGIAMLVFLWVAFRGCEVARGTESCGAGPGMVLLVVVFALSVLVGRLLLGLLHVPEAGMTSFLAVGLTSLVAILLLSGLFDSVAIVVVIPLLSAAAFVASAWVGTLQLSPDD